MRGQRGIGAGTRGLLSGEGGSVPCRCPAPWPRHRGGCRRRGPAQGPNPRASSDAGGGAAHGSGGGCRCHRRSTRGRGGRSEGADGDLSGRQRLSGAPAAPPAPPQRPALGQPRLRLPGPVHRPAALIGCSAQARALGCFRRRPKSASPWVTRQCLRRQPLRVGPLSRALPALLGPYRARTGPSGLRGPGRIVPSGRTVTQAPGFTPALTPEPGQRGRTQPSLQPCPRPPQAHPPLPPTLRGHQRKREDWTRQELGQSAARVGMQVLDHRRFPRQWHCLHSTSRSRTLCPVPAPVVSKTLLKPEKRNLNEWRSNGGTDIQSAVSQRHLRVICSLYRENNACNLQPLPPSTFRSV